MNNLIAKIKAQPYLLVVLLVLAFLAQGIFLIQDTSPTTDETAFHMANGYTYLVTHDYRMSPANPAFTREWMTLPWLFIHPKLDLDKTSWKEADSVPFSQEFFYKDNRAIANLLLYSARFMILILGLILGMVIFVWSKSLYGIWGGVLSLSLYAFCPVFLAHSSIAHTDLAVSFFCTLSAYFLWRYLEYNRQQSLWAFAFSFGLACAAKYNALYLGPLFLMMILFRKGFVKFLFATFLTVAVSFFVIWACYFFEFKPLLWEGVPRIGEKLGYITNISNAIAPGNEKIRQFFLNAARQVPIPMPSYILGFAGIIRSHQAPYLYYSFGRWTVEPVWYHYLAAFLTKMTLPFLFLLLLRTLFFKKSSSGSRNENLVILPPVLVLFVLTCFDSTGVGIRYLLVVIGMLMVWAGGLVRLTNFAGLWKWVLGIAVVLNMVSAIAVFPNYLSYFNEAVGGVKNGYKCFRAGDVDWGQGLKGLKRYMDKHKIEAVKLDYFGTADPTFYGIRYKELTDAEKRSPQHEIYAISVLFLEHTKWAPKIKPTAIVSGSIFIYDFSTKGPSHV